MSAPRLTLCLVLVFALLAPGASQSLAQPAASPVVPASPAAPGTMLIVENAGQWPAAARFQVWNSPLGPGTTWLAEDAIWLVVSRQVDKEEVDKEGSSHCDDHLVYLPTCLPPSSSHALKLTFPGSNPDVRIESFGAAETTVSYFLGNDPEQWQPDVPVWSGVRYVDLYPGVDLVLGGSDGAWRFEAAPGATTGQVRIQVGGANVVALDGSTLQLAASGKLYSVTLPAASLAYYIAGLSLQGDPLVVTVPPALHVSQSAQPDDNPADLLYSTFLGGSGRDYGSGIVVNSVGSAYVVGYVWWSSDFPATPGAFDPTLNGDYDAFVVKLDPAGSTLTYATFLGGTSEDIGYGIAVDDTGSAFVVGRTWSSNFPTSLGAFDATHNGNYDAFVVKLNPLGSALDYATYLGGGVADICSTIAIDELGNAFVTGYSDSTDFPTTPAALNPNHSGWFDAFVVKLNPDGGGLAYSTFLGGIDYDYGISIDLDNVGQIFVTGHTSSDDFPTTPGAFGTSRNGSSDAFVAKLSTTGSVLVYSSFLGGSGGEEGSGIAVDETGNAFVTGWTSSSDFPTTPGAFDTGFNGGYGDAFVAKLNSGGSDLLYATFLGGDDGEGGADIAIDTAGSTYVLGTTTSSDFPTTPGAFGTTLNYPEDAFVVKLNPVGSDLSYATFIGGSHYDYGDGGIAVSSAGSAYVTGHTGSSDFPITAGAFDTNFNGDLDAFVTRLDAYDPNVVAPIEQPRPGAWISGTVTLRGFALDWGSVTGPGVDAVRLYADGLTGAGTLIGNATYGLARPGLAPVYGAAFVHSGWELSWDTTGLAPGIHRLYLYAHRTTDNAWSAMDPHLVVAPGGPARWLPIVLRQR
jgi:hypothetical protein